MNHDNIKLDLVDFDYDGNTTIGDYTVTISQDDDPMNPRVDFDNLGTMVCWHNRYDLGDKHGYETPMVLMHVLSGLYPETATEDLTDDQRNRCYIVASEKAIVLPLYLYDHSGITMRVSAFNDAFDSGQVGYIYVTKEKIREEYVLGRVSPKMNKRIVKSLVAEVEQYDQYLTGEVYGYNIVKNTGDDEEFVDSCWGFFGHESSGIEEEIRAAIAYDIANTPQQLEMDVA